MEFKRYSDYLSKMRAKEEILSQQYHELIRDVESLNNQVVDLVQVQEVFNLVGVLAQTEMREVVELLVTDALQFVFGEEYGFVIDNQIVRNQPESNFYVTKGNQRFSLREELGGGVVDVVSFALRFVCWAIQIDRTAPIVFFDEPLKFVDKNRLPLLHRMIKELTSLLEVQTIMVTHEQNLIDAADVCYHVSQENGISVVERLK